MNAQNQISSGVPLDGRDRRRLVEIVEVAAKLGAPGAVLGVWPRGVYLFAADDLQSPAWWFDGAFRWRRARTQSSHALIAPPAEIAYALSRAGGPRVRVGFGKDRAWFLGPRGVAEVLGRVISLKDDAALVSAYEQGPIFAIVQFVTDELKSAARDASARGILELRLVRGPGVDPKWEAYAVNEGERTPLQTKAVMEPERDVMGRYDATILNTILLLRMGKYLGITFTGSPESPALFADWMELDTGLLVKFLVRPLG
jgi:hypothetical protein